MEHLNNGHVGTSDIVHYSEVSFIGRLVIVNMYYTIQPQKQRLRFLIIVVMRSQRDVVSKDTGNRINHGGGYGPRNSNRIH